MTQEIFGAKWQDDVIALAIENPEVEIASQGTDTLIVRAVFGKGMASKRVNNADLTFAIADAPAATATDVQVGAKTGVITAGSTEGTAVVSVLLTGYNKVEPAYARVTVKNG